MQLIKKLSLCCLVLFSLISWAVYAAGDDVEDGGKDKREVHHLFDDIDLVSALKTQYGKKPNSFMKFVYPALQSDEESEGVTQFNATVKKIIDQQTQEYKAHLNDIQTAVKNGMPVPKGKNELYIDYDSSTVQSGKNHIISIRFSIQGIVAGMAHPYHNHVVLNYDIEEGKELALADLFKSNADYLTLLSNYSRSMLEKKVQNQQMLLDGTAPKEENFKYWNLKSNGILITFNEAQVAPAVYGTQTVLVPYSAVKEISDDASPIADCVFNRKKCTRHNLLTGGFIDEAAYTRDGLFDPSLS